MMTQGSTAACRIKFGEEMGILVELRKAEKERHEWMNQALASRNEIEYWCGHVLRGRFMWFRTWWHGLACRAEVREVISPFRRVRM